MRIILYIYIYIYNICTIYDIIYNWSVLTHKNDSWDAPLILGASLDQRWYKVAPGIDPLVTTNMAIENGDSS